MKKRFVVAAAVMTVCAQAMILFAAEQPKNSGEANYKKLCALCHPDGGNIVNSKKTLHKSDREANNIKTEQDIVKVMRNPGPGMTKFDAKTVSDKDAREIARYILDTFK